MVSTAYPQITMLELGIGLSFFNSTSSTNLFLNGSLPIHGPMETSYLGSVHSAEMDGQWFPG